MPPHLFTDPVLSSARSPSFTHSRVTQPSPSSTRRTLHLSAFLTQLVFSFLIHPSPLERRQSHATHATPPCQRISPSLTRARACACTCSASHEHTCPPCLPHARPSPRAARPTCQPPFIVGTEPAFTGPFSHSGFQRASACMLAHLPPLMGLCCCASPLGAELRRILLATQAILCSVPSAQEMHGRPSRCR